MLQVYAKISSILFILLYFLFIYFTKYKYITVEIVKENKYSSVSKFWAKNYNRVVN